jgi:hypothetical protein
MTPLDQRPFGHLFVPAVAAFFTCFAISVGISAVMGVEMRLAVPAGVLVSATVAWYAAFSHARRSRKR